MHAAEQVVVIRGGCQSRLPKVAIAWDVGQLAGAKARHIRSCRGASGSGAAAIAAAIVMMSMQRLIDGEYPKEYRCASSCRGGNQACTQCVGTRPLETQKQPPAAETQGAG